MNTFVQGIPIIVSAPSGAGKTSLLRAALPEMDWCELVVSHTTRDCRPGEVDGEDYHFVSEDRFLEMVNEGQFLEHANVYGNYYGTSKSAIESIIARGNDAVLEIDWQGAQQVRKLYDEHQSIFVLPPSRQSLMERLTSRAKDKLSVIERRMNQAIDEMSHYVEYDFLIFNDSFDEALVELMAVFRSIRCQGRFQVQHHAALLNDLLGSNG